VNIAAYTCIKPPIRPGAISHQVGRYMDVIRALAGFGVELCGFHGIPERLRGIGHV